MKSLRVRIELLLLSHREWLAFARAQVAAGHLSADAPLPEPSDIEATATREEGGWSVELSPLPALSYVGPPPPEDNFGSLAAWARAEDDWFDSHPEAARAYFLS